MVEQLTRGIEFVRFQCQVRVFICIVQIFLLEESSRKNERPLASDRPSTYQKVQKRQIRRS